MKLLDSIHEAGAGAKCLITLAAVAAALLIGGVFISILPVSYTHLIIYPCINVVLMGDDARQLLAFFDESAEDEGVQVKADLDEGSRERPAQSLGLDDRGGDEDGTDEDESDGTGPYGTDGEPDRE